MDHDQNERPPSGGQSGRIMSWREALLWGTAIVVALGAVLLAAYISLRYFIPGL